MNKLGTHSLLQTSLFYVIVDGLLIENYIVHEYGQRATKYV